MDAREYLARKGLDGGRDRERPNTLEEKAWERARESGEHRPRAGTPHDWEDWERYHDALAEGVEEIEQKIDHEAHPHGGAHDADALRAVKSHDAARPAPAEQGRAVRKAPPPPWSAELRLALLTLAILMPPLAVGLTQGGAHRILVSLLLTLLGWLPGVLHAWGWVRRMAR